MGDLTGDDPRERQIFTTSHCFQLVGPRPVRQKNIHSLRFGLFTVSLSWLEVLRSIVEGSPFWFLFKCHHLHKSLFLQNTAKNNLAEAKDIFLCRQVKVKQYLIIENLTQKVHKYIQLLIYEKQGDL